MLLLTAMEGDDLKGDLLRCRSDLDIAEVRRLKQTDEKNAAASKLQALFKGRKARKEMEGDTTRLRDERLERRREGHERQRLNIALRRFYAAQDLALPTSVEAIVDHYWNTWSLLDERLVERYEHLPSDFALLHFVEEGHHASLGHQRAQSHIGRHRNARVANARSARAARRPKPKLSATKRAATAGRKKSTRSSSKSPSRKSKSPKTKSPKSKKPKVTIDERFSATLAKASDVERGVPYRAHIAKALAQDLPYGNSSSFCMRRLTSKAVGKRAAAAAAAAAAVRKGEKRTPKSDVGPHAELRGKLLELASALPSGMRPNAVRAVRDLYLHSVDFCFRQYPPDHMTQVRRGVATCSSFFVSAFSFSFSSSSYLKKIPITHSPPPLLPSLSRLSPPRQGFGSNTNVGAQGERVPRCARGGGRPRGGGGAEGASRRSETFRREADCT